MVHRCGCLRCVGGRGGGTAWFSSASCPQDLLGTEQNNCIFSHVPGCLKDSRINPQALTELAVMWTQRGGCFVRRVVVLWSIDRMVQD